MKTIILLFILIFPARAFAADVQSVASKQANIRSGPGTDYEVVWRAAKYYPMEVIGHTGSWLKVSDYENDQGWIAESLLSETPAVVVVTAKANVRSGPGTDYEVLWVVEKEYSLKVLQTDGDWFKVADGVDLVGWIHKSVSWGFAGEITLQQNETIL